MPMKATRTPLLVVETGLQICIHSEISVMSTKRGNRNNLEKFTRSSNALELYLWCYCSRQVRLPLVSKSASAATSVFNSTDLEVMTSLSNAPQHKRHHKNYRL